MNTTEVRKILKNTSISETERAKTQEKELCKLFVKYIHPCFIYGINLLIVGGGVGGGGVGVYYDCHSNRRRIYRLVLKVYERFS